MCSSDNRAAMCMTCGAEAGWNEIARSIKLNGILTRRYGEILITVSDIEPLGWLFVGARLEANQQ
jgi:hypothetical protein